MSEEIEGQDTGAEAVAGGVDPAAAALALSGASREDAGAFLKDQRALIADQRHHLHEQFKHLHLSVWEKQLGVLLRLATAVVGITVAATLGLLVWDAAHSKGLIIEPFSMPPDMAARGLSGQVVANQMLDKLAVMQDATDSSRAPQSYENNWGDNIKVEIADTGISIGEVQQFLKAWLGHDTHITGEVWRTASGIAVTARESAEGGATFRGPESDLDALMQKAAEHVYSTTQPYRYANYLDRNYAAPDIAERAARAEAIYRKLIAGPSAQERGWAWNGLATIEAFVKGDTRAAVSNYQKAVNTYPDFTLGYFSLGIWESYLNRRERSLAALLVAKQLLHRSEVPDINPRRLALVRLTSDGNIAEDKGDYREAVRIDKAAADAPEHFSNLSRASFTNNALVLLARLRDPRGVRAYMRDLGISSIFKRFGPVTAIGAAAGLEDWQTIRDLEKLMPEGQRQSFYVRRPQIVAMLALAHAYTGDIKGAEALIVPSPDDSDDGLIARGRIAELQGQHDRADWWFNRAEKAMPSIPFADTAWGQALLTRGKPDQAIEKFKLANQKGPHFADPLEMWGEALMAKNQSHLALAKFAEAEKYAPNWGRLHLKWGEALVWSGKRDEAKKQFASAALLDLTTNEKSELARQPLHG